MNAEARVSGTQGLIQRSSLLGLAIVGLVLSGAAAASPRATPEPVSITKSRLSVAVDPRVELLSIVQYLSDYGTTHSELVTRLDFAYRKDVDNWFAPFESHSVIGMFGEMSSKGFSYDAPPHAVLYMNSDFSLNDVIFTDDDRDVTRAGGKEQTIAFASALKAFAAESDFATFYANHTSLYKRVVDNTFKNVKHQDVIDRIEEYYGDKRSAYTVVISPLLGKGNFGVQTELKEGIRDIYCIMGPYGADGGTPLFGSAEFFNQLQRHEFSHSFVNPLADTHASIVKKHADLFAPMSRKMEGQAYGEWQTVVNESVVRAVTTRLAYILDGREAGDKELQYHIDRGFVFSDALVKKLGTYEQNRTKYPTLDSFYPELLSVLDGFTPTSVAQMIRGSGELVVNDTVANAQVVVYDLPDKSDRADAIDYVQRAHGKFWPEKEIIDAATADDSSLKDKLKGDFVLYTAIGSRLFNAATKPLNIRIDGNTLSWNGVSAPASELRIIMVGKNPYGDGHCVIYAAGTNHLLVGINGVFHGPCSYHMFKGDALLKEGHYDESYSAMESKK